jgi:uncharacterized FAD-dependent dehydrogenase
MITNFRIPAKIAILVIFVVEKRKIMPISVTLQLSPKQAADPKIYIPIAARMARVSDTQIALAQVVKRSVDARKSPKINLSLELYIDNEPQPQPPHFEYQDVSGRTPVVIVGGGPAGLFAALRLIELGMQPIVLERGKEVAERGKDIAQIHRGGGVDPNSNYAFGEGGAGTFSDGKLYTRSKKRGDYNRALQTLVYHGAAPEILYEAHPHIGTDRLPRIMTAIRETIRRCGGQVVFGAHVTDIEIRNGRAIGVRFVEAGSLRDTRTSHGTFVEGAAVILATGHSARDIYEMLHRRGVALEAKPFAMGVRIEHPQQLIDTIQYHTPDGKGEYLPAASYQLVSQENGRGVWSFCMCPGGFIVPAMTDSAESVVNGMSPSLRNSPYANSGIVTEVRLSDFAHLTDEFGPLAGLEFQRRLEQAARLQVNNVQAKDMVDSGLLCRSTPRNDDRAYTSLRASRSNSVNSATAPAQRVADFVSARPSKNLPKSSYVPGLTPSRLDEWLPDFISTALRSGISTFGRRMRGFVTNEAVVVGVESRTSTPVRIPRDPDTLAHPAVSNLYPAGEGAGFAGGIISAALDGERLAEMIFRDRGAS